tara:strand:+ start:675 stop:1040 length:366 start_codon:yes stop_codon:yes gene_type:complete
MKRPLQALLISPGEEQREAILAGEKQITIREGHRAYSPGPVMLGCGKVVWCVYADITNVRITTLDRVTDEEYMDDGYESTLEMLKDLRQYYPDLGLESDVTVIRWDNVHGKLVDNYNERKD